MKICISPQRQRTVEDSEHKFATILIKCTEVKGGLLNIIIRKCVTILKLLASEIQALLLRRNALLVLDLGLHIVNCIGGSNLKAVSSMWCLFQFKVHLIGHALVTESYTKPNFHRFSVSWGFSGQVGATCFSSHNVNSTFHYSLWILVLTRSKFLKVIPMCTEDNENPASVNKSLSNGLQQWFPSLRCHPPASPCIQLSMIYTHHQIQAVDDFSIPTKTESFFPLIILFQITTHHLILRTNTWVISVAFQWSWFECLFFDSRLLVYFLRSDRLPPRVIAGNQSLHRPARR